MQFPQIRKKLEAIENGEAPEGSHAAQERVPRRRAVPSGSSAPAPQPKQAPKQAPQQPKQQPKQAPKPKQQPKQAPQQQAQPQQVSQPQPQPQAQPKPKQASRSRRKSAPKPQTKQQPKQQPVPAPAPTLLVTPELVTDVKLGTIYTRFHTNIKSVKRLTHVAEQMLADEKDVADDLFRAQVVQIESAFDFFMHEFTVFGMTKIFLDEWDDTREFRAYPITMKDFRAGIKSPDDDAWFAKTVMRAYEKQPLISYLRFTEALRTIGISLEALEKSSQGRLDARTLRTIVDQASSRRNQIAHQTDRAHASRKQNDIDAEYVRTMLSDIRMVVNAVYEAALEKSAKSSTGK